MKRKYWLFENGKYTKFSLMADKEAAETNKRCEAKGYSFRWVLPVLPDLKGRHVAKLRSICETFGGKDPYCTCGKVYNDPIHFTCEELKKLSPEELLMVWN